MSSEEQEINTGKGYTCESSSTSVPTKHRLPLEYTWWDAGDDSGLALPNTGLIRLEDTLHSFLNKDELNLYCKAIESGSDVESKPSDSIVIIYPSKTLLFLYHSQICEIDYLQLFLNIY